MTKQTNSIFRRLLMMLMLTASALQGRAANVECLTLTVSGKPVVIVLAEHPVITYKGNTLHVKTETTTIDIPVSEISGGSFQDPSTGIRTIELPDVEKRDGELRFSQLTPGSSIEVFSTDGVKLSSVRVDTYGQATVSIGQLPKGTYIVRSALQTIKIANK